MDVLRQFDPEVYERGLSSWGWLDLSELNPIASTLFGDTFFIGWDGIWFLDIAVGTLEHVAPTADEAEEIMQGEEGDLRYLLGPLAEELAEESGLVPEAHEVFAWRVAPVFGGAFEAANVELLELGEALWRAGHTHDLLLAADADAEAHARTGGEQAPGD